MKSFCRHCLKPIRNCNMEEKKCKNCGLPIVEMGVGDEKVYVHLVVGRGYLYCKEEGGLKAEPTEDGKTN